MIHWRQVRLSSQFCDRTRHIRWLCCDVHLNLHQLNTPQSTFSIIHMYLFIQLLLFSCEMNKTETNFLLEQLHIENSKKIMEQQADCQASFCKQHPSISIHLASTHTINFIPELSASLQFPTARYDHQPHQPNFATAYLVSLIMNSSYHSVHH